MVRFMKKNNVIKKKDYEEYEIIVPFSSLAGKRRKQFFCSELEKLHPCFSDEFIFDSIPRKITRRGLSENVFVMNKLKLAEYEAGRNLSGSGFNIERNQNEKTPKWYRFFVDKKWKLTISALTSCLLIGAVGLLSGRYAALSVKKTDSLKVGQVVVEKKSDFSSSPVRKVNELSGAALISSVAQTDGKIVSLDWRIESKGNGRYENLSAQVCAVFPEELQNYSFDKVIYKEGKPEINISFSQLLSEKALYAEISRMNPTSTLKNVLSNADFNKALRSLILEGGGQLKAENAPPYHLDFVFNFGSSKDIKKQVALSELLKNIFDLILSDKRSLTQFSINQNGKNEIGFGLSIENNSGEETSSGLIPEVKAVAENIKVFIPDYRESVPGKSVINQTAGKMQNDLDKGDKPAPTQVKLGEIRKADKSSLVFYKTNEGKIKSVFSTGE